MNTIKSKSKMLSTMTILLLFVSMVAIAIPNANAAYPEVDGKLLDSTGTTIITGASVGDRVVVDFFDAQRGGLIGLFWDKITDASKLGEVQLSGTQQTGFFNITVPEGNMTTHTLILAQLTTTSSGGVGAVVFSRDLELNIIPSLKPNPTSGLVGDVIELKGDGFTSLGGALTARTDIEIEVINGPSGAMSLVLTNALIRPNANGSFTFSFTVPAAMADYGTYTIRARNVNGIVTDAASCAFVVGASISLNPARGPTGTRLTVTGRGFLANSAITSLTFGGQTIALPTGFTTNAAGGFMYTFTVPSLASPTGDKTVAVAGTSPSGSAVNPSATFRVTGSAGLEVDPPAGRPYKNDVITLSGANFTAIAGTNVTVTMQTPYTVFAPVDTFKTNSDGTFSGTFKTPDYPSGLYTIRAVDENGIAASIVFAIHVTSIEVYEKGTLQKTTSFTTGTEIDIRGFGFDFFATTPPTTTFLANITIDGTPLRTNLPCSTDAQVVTSLRIPSSFAAGTHKIEITSYTKLADGRTVSLYGELDITITDTTRIVVDPVYTNRGTVLNVSGDFFGKALSNWVNIQIRNASTNAVVGTFTAPTKTTWNIAGNFTDAYFTIPTNFALGEYIINATDSFGLTAETKVTIAKLELTMELSGSKYVQGDIGSFRLTSPMKPTGSLSIYDSTGARYTELTIYQSDWVRIGNEYIYQPSYVGGVPSGVLFQISSDAKIGTWTWNATFKDVDEPLKFSGSFDVASKTATPTAPPASTAPPTETPPTATPDSPGPSIPWWVIALVVVALIIGVIAVFLVITMRQKIAN
jgi:hypothetical protein